MKLRKIGLLSVLMAVLLLSGCKKLHIIPYLAVNDLVKQGYVIMHEDMDFVDYQIHNRQTDDVEGVDRFQLVLETDHPAAEEYRIFEMEYVYSDHGWHLNSCTEQVERREIMPKAEPGEDEIIHALQASSDEQIAAAFAEQGITDERSALRFFDDAYFEADVYPGSMGEDNLYSCIVKSKNFFTRAITENGICLKLMFDPNTYTWVYYEDKVVASETSWNLVGTWNSEDDAISLEITRDDENEVYSFACEMDGQKASATGSVAGLDHTCLNPSVIRISNMDGKPICIDLEIGADRVMCFDRLTGKSWKLVPVDVEEESFQLENTGFQFVRLDEKMLEYREDADYVIGLLELRDLQTLGKMAIDQNAREDAFKLAELFNRADVKVRSVTYLTTQYFTENFPNEEIAGFFEELKEKVPTLNAFSETQYFLEVEYEEEIVDLFLKIKLIHGEDMLYLLSCR